MPDRSVGASPHRTRNSGAIGCINAGETREQNAVFQMHMRDEIIAEFLDTDIERRPGPARTVRKRKSMRQMLYHGEAPAFACMIVPHAGNQMFDIRIGLMAHHRKESELFSCHVGKKVILEVDQRVCKTQWRGVMRTVDVLHLLRKRDQPFQIGTVRLVITFQNVSDEFARTIRGVAPCGKLQRLKPCKQISGLYAGIRSRFCKRYVAATAKSDTVLPEQFGSTGKLARNHSDGGVQFVLGQCALLDAYNRC